ncbi:hypothetical protein ACFFWD_44530 [Bradyrhizobium erythrophlei]|uniref:hypothetical protein n=1 Tax=Bradyrhizobium erythrophlei TaxID=1437360 RepID=UPI0035EF3F59
MQRLVDLSAGHRKIILYTVPGREPFYAAFGFRRMTTAMAIFKDPAKAHAGGYLYDIELKSRPIAARQRDANAHAPDRAAAGAFGLSAAPP